MMFNFEFHNGTKIIFGKGLESQVGAEIKANRASKVLLHYGGGSVKRSGLYDRIVASLQEAGVSFIELGGVKANPLDGLVYEGIKLCRENGIDFILAVGGGSVIDSAKAIAAGVGYNGDFWDLFMDATITPNACLPVATVLTIPAAGSETSASMVITKEELKLKRSRAMQELRPVFSIMNPELTFTLPDYQTACGISDMLSHVIERYFVNRGGYADFTDRMCEATMKSIVVSARKLMNDPNNYDLRSEIMLAGMVAHNDSINYGRSPGPGRGGDWSSHQIEHELSGFYDLAHGAGLAIIIPAWMKYVYKQDIALFAQFGERVFDLEINTSNLEETALAAIAELEKFYHDINLPTRFSEADLPTNEIDELVASLMTGRDRFGSFVTIDAKAAKAIYELAL